MRTLVDIPDDMIASLDAMAEQNKRSRAAEMRAALRDHLRRHSNNDWIRRGAGYWANRDDITDGVVYQQAIREDREFD